MNRIKEAQEYVFSSVLEPALQHQSLSENFKRKVRNTKIWLYKFERVGDLLIYLKRFSAGNNDPFFIELRKHNLKTFEEIVVDFEHEFSDSTQDCTRASDFIIDNNYTSHQILIFARCYDTRSGGMFVLEAGDKVSSIIIKATLAGGKYSNEWNPELHQLKYYLKSINNKFDERYKPNAAILNNQFAPILTFVRELKTELFTYKGIFHNLSINYEKDDSKWFNLERAAQQPKDVLLNESTIAYDLNMNIKASSALSPSQRQIELKKWPDIPVKIQAVSTAFIRNPHVIAEALYLAKGLCENCKQPAPFFRRSDSSPFLEVHHRIPLAAGGKDTLENAIALCPNCHRKAHFGENI